MKEEEKIVEIGMEFKGALDEYAKMSDEEIATHFNKHVLPEIIKNLHKKPQLQKDWYIKVGWKYRF
ncbi:MAG: hypothetical protein EHM12_01980 [Dehalococcoidia bacterium]|nr:MAG: hypothetical protein EHM12_01980 [Dehalococcoidia bacterium]